MKPVSYETERLLLKPLGPDAAPLVLDYYRRNRTFLLPWEPLREESFYQEITHRTQLAKDVAQGAAGDALRLWLFKWGEEERVIGSIGFSNIVQGVFQSCHLGYKLDQDELSRGYMTEALRRGIEVILQDYRLHRIEANIMPRNTRSLRLVEQLDFQNEGLSPQYLKINGVWEDHIHMVRLNPTPV